MNLFIYTILLYSLVAVESLHTQTVVDNVACIMKSFYLNEHFIPKSNIHFSLSQDSGFVVTQRENLKLETKKFTDKFGTLFHEEFKAFQIDDSKIPNFYIDSFYLLFEPNDSYYHEFEYNVSIERSDMKSFSIPSDIPAGKYDVKLCSLVLINDAPMTSVFRSQAYHVQFLKSYSTVVCSPLSHAYYIEDFSIIVSHHLNLIENREVSLRIFQHIDSKMQSESEAILSDTNDSKGAYYELRLIQMPRFGSDLVSVYPTVIKYYKPGKRFSIARTTLTVPPTPLFSTHQLILVRFIKNEHGLFSYEVVSRSRPFSISEDWNISNHAISPKSQAHFSSIDKVLKQSIDPIIMPPILDVFSEFDYQSPLCDPSKDLSSIILDDPLVEIDDNISFYLPDGSSSMNMFVGFSNRVGIKVPFDISKITKLFYQIGIIDAFKENVTPLRGTVSSVTNESFLPVYLNSFNNVYEVPVEELKSLKNTFSFELSVSFLSLDTDQLWNKSIFAHRLVIHITGDHGLSRWVQSASSPRFAFCLKSSHARFASPLVSPDIGSSSAIHKVRKLLNTTGDYYKRELYSPIHSANNTIVVEPPLLHGITIAILLPSIEIQPEKETSKEIYDC